MSNYSILVVDDRADNFEVIEAFLSDRDYTLHYASNGQAAIDSLDKFDPDTILLDAMMPDLDGLEVCRIIKAMPRWQAVPIIMVTALSSKTDLARCLAAGADDFICKPVNSIELRSRVQSMLRIKKQHDRIQSLSRLQRNNIHSLQNSLNELRLDLAVSFPDELNISLLNILDEISLAQQHLDDMSMAEIRDLLISVDNSARNLDKLNQKFLFYLQLNLVTSEVRKHQFCVPEPIIEQVVTEQANQMKSASEIIFDLENNTGIAVSPSHLEYIINELTENAFAAYKSEQVLYIHGKIIDHAFHFWIDNQVIKSVDKNNSKLSELIRFDSGSDREQELEMGLKIVKKIVEIYDGLFLIANTDSDNITIYIALPLASPVSE